MECLFFAVVYYTSTMNKNKKLLGIVALILFVLCVGILIGRLTKGNTNVEPTPTQEVVVTTSPEVIEVQEEAEEVKEKEVLLDEHGTYDTKDEVALFIHQYNRLPDNFMTKKEAREYGWSGGALNRVVKGKCIGGDVFSNFEGVLPDIDGTYYECDIDTLTKKKRGAKRIVFSDEGDIYYTEDHYESFELLYGADE